MLPMDLANPSTPTLMLNLAKGIFQRQVCHLVPSDCSKLLTVGQWLAGSNYWTAGYKFTHEDDSFGWCVGQSMLPLMKNSTLWANGRPGNSSDGRNCILFRMDQLKKNAPVLSLSDRNCTHRYSFACQVSLNGSVKLSFLLARIYWH